MTNTTRNGHLAYMHTLAQLGLSMNGEATDKLYEACGDSVAFSNTMIRLAEQFEDEWRQLTPEEHDEVGDDYIEEVEKLAAWIEDHIDDVANNLLEYGGYQAGRLEWAVVKTACDTEDGKVLYSKRTVLTCDNQSRVDAFRNQVADDISTYIRELSYIQVQNLCFRDDFGSEMAPFATMTYYDHAHTQREEGTRIEWRLEKRRVPLKESK